VVTPAKKVGLLVGREESFPKALIAEVATRNTGVVCELAEIDSPRAEVAPPYEVLVDRISHEVTCYQPWLKLAAMCGTRVVNDPFWRIADDKFFNAGLASRLGVRVPKTRLLPSKTYGDDVTSGSLRNLKLVDWDALAKDLAFPMYMKPHWGGGWRDVSRVSNVEELHAAYDKSGRLTMIVQEEIRWTRYVRCIVIGRRDVRAALWNPSLSHHERYVRAAESMPPLDAALEARAIKDALTITRALGYDMNTVELAIAEDGTPYAIDFMNSAPDLDVASLGDEHFAWAVSKMADLVVRLASEPAAPKYRWEDLVRGA
jgi:hypothetical protein